MRYVTLVIDYGDEFLHPLAESLEEEDEITREAIHELKLLDDGTAVLMGEISGNLEKYRKILDEAQSVIDYTVSGDGEGYTYCHFETNDYVRDLMERQNEFELVIEMPIDVTEDGGHRITLVGDEKSFQKLDSYPEDLDMRVEEVGEYHPEARRLVSRLTGRQQEILELAVEEGYYRDPRQVTHRELAEKIGLSPGTVGEHLRKIEERVFSEMLPGA